MIIFSLFFVQVVMGVVVVKLREDLERIRAQMLLEQSDYLPPERPQPKIVSLRIVREEYQPSDNE